MEALSVANQDNWSNKKKTISFEKLFSSLVLRHCFCLLFVCGCSAWIHGNWWQIFARPLIFTFEKICNGQPAYARSLIEPMNGLEIGQNRTIQRLTTIYVWALLWSHWSNKLTLSAAYFPRVCLSRVFFFFFIFIFFHVHNIVSSLNADLRGLHIVFNLIYAMLWY